MQFKTGKPTNSSCWRYGFRYHQQLCIQSAPLKGCMLQVVEGVSLKSVDGRCDIFEETGSDDSLMGAGQRIETEMAKELGLKIFRVKGASIYGSGKSYVDSLDME